MNSFVIDRMREMDLGQIVALEQECGLNSRGVEKYRQALADPRNILLAASDSNGDSDGQIVGLFSGQIVLDELQIDNLAVVESQRRQGLATRLLRLGLSEASRFSASHAVLEVRASNTAAASLYARCGFVSVGIRRAYYRSPDDDAMTMNCDLGSVQLPENVA